MFDSKEINIKSHIPVAQTCRESPLRFWVMYYACESPHKDRHTKGCTVNPNQLRLLENRVETDCLKLFKFLHKEKLNMLSCLNIEP